MNMAKPKKGKTKSIAEQVASQGKANLIAAVVTGLVMSAVFVLITGKYVEALLVLATSVITSQVLRFTSNSMIKKIALKFEEELDDIREGDYSKFLEPKSFGVLAGIGSALNSVLSDIRSLVDNFFSLSHLIIQASRKVGSTAEQALSSITEISKTVDEIAKGASDQAADAQEGVQLVDKLSEQIDFVYQSYGDVMNETNNIHNLNDIGLESVKILREKSEQSFNSTEKIFSGRKPYKYYERYRHFCTVDRRYRRANQHAGAECRDRSCKASEAGRALPWLLKKSDSSPIRADGPGGDHQPDGKYKRRIATGHTGNGDDEESLAGAERSC